MTSKSGAIPRQEQRHRVAGSAERGDGGHQWEGEQVRGSRSDRRAGGGHGGAGRPPEEAPGFRQEEQGAVAVRVRLRHLRLA